MRGSARFLPSIQVSFLVLLFCVSLPWSTFCVLLYTVPLHVRACTTLRPALELVLPCF